MGEPICLGLTKEPPPPDSNNSQLARERRDIAAAVTTATATAAAAGFQRATSVEADAGARGAAGGGSRFLWGPTTSADLLVAVKQGVCVCVCV